MALLHTAVSLQEGEVLVDWQEPALEHEEKRRYYVMVFKQPYMQHEQAVSQVDRQASFHYLKICRLQCNGRIYSIVELHRCKKIRNTQIVFINYIHLNRKKI